MPFGVSLTLVEISVLDFFAVVPHAASQYCLDPLRFTEYRLRNLYLTQLNHKPGKPTLANTNAVLDMRKASS